MNAVASWFSKNKKSPWLIIFVALATMLIIIMVTNGGTLNLSGTAGKNNDTCDTSWVDANPEMGIVITQDGVYVRSGPNVNYDFVNPDNRGLKYCTMFKMLGRDTNGTWLYVSSDELEGWIYYDSMLEKVNIDITSLPVRGASVPQVQEDIPAGFHANIDGNIAHVTITDLPANKPFYIRLGPDGNAKKEINFFQGVADINGKANIYQEMPYVWEDGSEVEAGRLLMTLFMVEDNEKVDSIKILYDR